MNKTADLDRELVLDLLRKYTKHKNVKLVNRGNAAIMCALSIAKKINPKSFLLIPDEGGWISFKKYPQLLGFELRTVKTNRGVIDLIDLEKKADSGAALLITSFAGYTAEQPLKYISNICKKHGCLLIEDASGAIGDEELCNGEYSDIIVGSFGEWKPVNVGYGGFISVAKKQNFDQGSTGFSMTNFYPNYSILLQKLKIAKERLEKMFQLQEEVKKECSGLDFNVLHKKLRGLNVIIKPMKESDKEDIIDYCQKKGFEYTECPRYIRIEEDAISIELKRIDQVLENKT